MRYGIYSGYLQDCYCQNINDAEIIPRHNFTRVSVKVGNLAEPLMKHIELDVIIKWPKNVIFSL